MASGRLRGETAFQRQRCGPAGSQGPPLRAAELRAAEKTAEPRPQRLGSTLAALTRSRKAEGTETSPLRHHAPLLTGFADGGRAVLVAQWSPTLCDPVDCTGFLCLWDSPMRSLNSVQTQL